MRERAWRETVHNGRDTATVSLPHGSEPPLSAKVPKLYRDVSFGYFSHVEPNLGLIIPRITFQYKEKHAHNLQTYILMEDVINKPKIHTVGIMSSL